jgi:hypothetical protein
MRGENPAEFAIQFGLRGSRTSKTLHFAHAQDLR